MRVNRSADEVAQMFKTLIAMIRDAKKALDKENAAFKKEGVTALVDNQVKMVRMLQDFYDHYKEVINTKGLRTFLAEDLLKNVAKEYDDFAESLKKYYINLEVAGKVSDVFMESFKKSVEMQAKKDYAYNKNGELVSDNNVASISHVSFNNKV